MKQISVFVVIFSLFLIPSRSDIIYPDGHVGDSSLNFSGVPKSIKKFSRGLSNVAFAAFEIPHSIWDTSSDSGVLDPRPITQGILLGASRAIQRLKSGVYDLATALENDSTLIHLDPEFIGVQDMIPGYNEQFGWESLRSSPPSPTFHY